MRRPQPDQLRLAALGGAVVLVVVFALVNLDDVAVNWIVFSSSTPLIVVIAVSFVLGLVSGVLLWRRGRAHGPGPGSRRPR